MPVSQILIQDTPGVFNGNTSITSVDLRNTSFVNNTMEQTFGYCENLTSVTNIPNSVVNMTNTFGNCNSLTTLVLNLPAAINLTNICNYCRNLSSVTLNTPAVTILNHAFSFTNITSFDIPPTVTDLGFAFSGCHRLTGTVTIPASVTIIDSCFLSTDVTNIQFTGNNLRRAAEAFTWMNRMTEAPLFPPSLSNMAGTFAQATSIVNCNYIQNTVTNMYMTFSSANHLTKIATIPSNVVNINRAFYNSTVLTGDIYINSSVIKDAVNCFNSTSLSKQVYIPFTYNIPFPTLYCWESSFNSDTPDRPQWLYTTTTSPTTATTLYYADGTVFNKTAIASASSSNIRLTGMETYRAHNRKSEYDITNGAVTRTYNSFTSAGYTTTGTVNGVYLKDITPILQTQSGTVTYTTHGHSG